MQPAEQPEARIESYDEEWYYAKQGDTLEAICQKFFFSPKYEQALRQYNLDRNYSPIFRTEKPSLSQGNVVKVPPARVLERLYPNAIPGARATGNTRAAPAPGPGPEPTIPTAPTAIEDVGSPREFVVRRDGMTLKDIAKEEMGNVNQWQRTSFSTAASTQTKPCPREQRSSCRASDRKKNEPQSHREHRGRKHRENRNHLERRSNTVFLNDFVFSRVFLPLCSL